MRVWDGHTTTRCLNLRSKFLARKGGSVLTPSTPNHIKHNVSGFSCKPDTCEHPIRISTTITTIPLRSNTSFKQGSSNPVIGYSFSNISFTGGLQFVSYGTLGDPIDHISTAIKLPLFSIKLLHLTQVHIHVEQLGILPV